MRYALHIHLGGKYQYIVQLFLSGDFKIGKFALPIVEVGVR